QNGFAGAAATGQIWSERRNMNFIADWTRVLDLRASFGRFTSSLPDGVLDSDFTAKSLGMTQMPHAPTSTRDSPPRIQVDQFTDIIGNQTNQLSWGTDNQWNIASNVTWTRGTKTIKFGGEYVYAMRGSGSLGRANGQFTFSRKWTQRYPLRGIDRFDGAGI